MKNLVSIKELADEAKVTPATVRRWIRKGALPSPPLEMGRSRYWHRKYLNYWMAGRAAKAMKGAQG
ncbi:helix-turn-helix domain-containing protein [Aeromonas caviae]|uniref:helix-turn-helix domain-containing protein n=1 Tax=Aeromonas caviae TaxID=648 RepID=UPI002B49BCB3|nr:helix-turn-helix domain-containing protein [Aeromonas caviae]